MVRTRRPPDKPAAPVAVPSGHRSGAVARMLRMPVATLRVWERRYALTQAALTPSGQRLYSDDDVRRLALIRQLTGLGHAVGRLARLDMKALQRIAATHAQTLADRASAAPTPAAAAPRRWDDAALADFAALSTTVACECPRHVAELLVQLSRFEAYSAQCRQRSPADAALHAYLERVAGGARAAFEQALEQVALHEGLLLAPAGRGT